MRFIGRYLTPGSILHVCLMSLLLNSYLLIKLSYLSLIGIVPAFLLLNVFSLRQPAATHSIRLKICHHGTAMLVTFICSLIPSLIWHAVLLMIGMPESYTDALHSAIWCVLLSALLFWNGIISIYCTSVQMGLRWRILGAVCGMIPILNLIILARIVGVTAEELEFELEKEAITTDPALADICRTKYPIVFVHGVFFRDSKLFNYWGRIPRTLKLHGATVYYGAHQSALTVKESGRELAYRIKLIVDRSGCEKVNIIAHSKGGLDCRYAISEFGLAPYVASLTTVNTPHRGCIFAQRLLYAIPERIKNSIAKVYNATLTALGDEEPDFIAAVTDLTAEACEARNATLTMPEGIYVQSIGSVLSSPERGQFPLNLSYRYVKSFDGENDGLVGESSFAFGERYTLLRTDGKRGISHGDVIDLNRENIRGFDVRAFYTDLVKDLRDRGL